MVQSGRLDSLPVKPVNPIALLSTQQFNVGYFSHFAIAVSIFAWSVGSFEVDWFVHSVLFLVLTVIGGSLLQAEVLALLVPFVIVNFLPATGLLDEDGEVFPGNRHP